MSIRVMTQVWDRSSQKGSCLLLLLAIADNANDEGYAWPSVATLARKVRMSERAVHVLIKGLVTSGELDKDEGGGRHRTNLYRVTLKGAVVNTENFAPIVGEQPGNTEKSGSKRVQNSARKGAVATAPEPSLNGHEPSVRASARHTHTGRAGAQGARQGAADPQAVLELVRQRGHVVGLSSPQRRSVEECDFTSEQIAEGWTAALDGTWEKWKARDVVFNYVLADLPEYFAKQNARSSRPKKGKYDAFIEQKAS